MGLYEQNPLLLIPVIIATVELWSAAKALFCHCHNRLTLWCRRE